MAAFMFSLLPEGMMAQDDFFYIFLCFGQSNMVGQGEITEADKVVDESFLSLSAVDGPDGRRVGQWRPAVPPLCRANTGLSLVDFFGRTLRKNFPDKVRIGVVYVAVDGCAIDLFDKDAYKQYVESVKADWMKNEIAAYDGNPYGRLVEMARKAQREGVIRGILLHQGETDAYNDLWLQKVKKIYGDLMTDLKLDPKRVPLIAGEAVNADQQGICAHANPTINRLPEVIPNCYVVSSKGCEAGSDKLHFTAKGYRTLGTRYGLKMMKAMGFDITNGDATEEIIGGTSAKPSVGPSIDVDGSLDSKGVFHAEANMPVEKIEFVSYSGKVLKTVPMNGQTKMDIDTKQYPEEQRLVIVFHAKNGSSVSVETRVTTVAP